VNILHKIKDPAQKLAIIGMTKVPTWGGDVSVYVCMHVCVRVYMYVHKYRYVNIQTDTYIHAYIYIRPLVSTGIRFQGEEKLQVWHADVSTVLWMLESFFP
jgi:hypothetical protein